jgi:hypothetical protein
VALLMVALALLLCWWLGEWLAVIYTVATIVVTVIHLI